MELRDNVILAKYLGMQLGLPNDEECNTCWYYGKIYGLEFEEKELKFSTDWNWLTIVINKYHNNIDKPLIQREFRIDISYYLVDRDINRLFKHIVYLIKEL